MKLPKPFLYLLLSLLSGVLLWLAWPPHQLGWISFFAFVPLLFLVKIIEIQNPGRSRLQLFLYAYTGIVVWNVLCTFWIRHAAQGGDAGAYLGAISASFVVNGLLMPLPLLAYQWLRKKLPASFEPVAFIAPWICFEFFHYNWELAWPWLTLGNAFANNPDWIQWYEYTGALGGSVWILWINYLVYQLADVSTTHSTKRKLSFIGGIIASVLFPYIISLNIAGNYTAKGHGVEVVIVQPSVDPYNEKFTIDPSIQLNNMLQHATLYLDSQTKYLVLPETAITEYIPVNDAEHCPMVYRLREFLQRYPTLTIVSGAETFKAYPDSTKKTITARYSKSQGVWYDSFNSAVLVNLKDSVQFYHKIKLVPGVEHMPYPKLLGLLGNIALDLGGTSGSLGTQSESSVFINSSEIIAPVICYESVFGDYVSSYARKGANLIFLVTNDGWWKDSDGYKQHCAYASLRAIELRRSIARSANTGTSCFIDPLGNRTQSTAWWQPAVIKSTVFTNDAMTFYSLHGDWIGWLMTTIVVLLFSSAIVLKKLNG
ncbi:MAG: apolipoprotein N-acyltransferase [Bacteroidia bacterium]|nr:apolipoprotein N-acyltransferase [Bacteroidia bacterium]